MKSSGGKCVGKQTSVKHYAAGGVVEPKVWSATLSPQIPARDIERSDINFQQSKLLKKALKDKRK